MTNQQFTSLIISTLKSTSKDSKIPRRLVLAVGESKVKTYISQKLTDRSLYRETNIQNVINCVEFIKIDIVDCPLIEFRLCNSIYRSKEKLPKIIWSKYGHTIKEIRSLDNQEVFTPTTISQYRKDKNRTHRVEKNQFYLEDDYIWVIDREFLMGNVVLITQDLYEVEQICQCSDKKCDSVWDFEFVCPDKLEEVVIQETLKQLSLTLQIKEDVNPNLNPNG
jgi:hypothetical protein